MHFSTFYGYHMYLLQPRQIMEILGKLKVDDTCSFIYKLYVHENAVIKNDIINFAQLVLILEWS